MENNFNDQFNNDIAPLPEKPQFLKVLCILSFVGCGLMILCFAIGSILLTLNEDMIAGVWPKVLETQPQLEKINPIEFFHQVGWVCVYSLLANVASLIGVILMWRLNKAGFFIYAIAELAANFFGMGLNAGEESKSYGSTVFMIILDLVFIVMYALNLKYMNKKAAQEIMQ